MKRSLSAVLILVAAASIGAGTLVSRRSSARVNHPRERVESPPKNWSVPFNGQGTEVATIAQALPQVDFAVRVPTNQAEHIVVNHDADVVGWSFKLPDMGGWVQLTEGRARMTAEQFQRQFLESESAPGFFSATTVDGGRVPATLAAANGVGRLLWIDGGVQFDLTGEGITPAQVATLAESLLYGAV